MSYSAIYQQSINAPAHFWAKAAAELHWEKPWENTLDETNSPFNQWFIGGELNTCFNCVDRHVRDGRGDQLAIIYDSPVTHTLQRFTYRELQQRVAKIAGMLAEKGVTKGDRVVIYLPMIPEALMGMLACARLGAIHSVVFGGFAARELAIRIDDAKPKVILSASCGIETNRVIPYKPLLDAAIDMSTHKPDACFIVQRAQAEAYLVEGRDFDWLAQETLAEEAACVPVLATDPLYILYTSGTTGQPKGVVRDNGGHATALLWSMKHIYDIEPGDVYWAASDVGWVVGHSYIVYGPLLQGATTLVYEGKPVGTPDPGAFWRVITDHKVKVLFTAPTAFRAIKKEDSTASYLQKYDLKAAGFKALFLAGERCDPDTLLWAQKILDVPVIDHWWQTETGWAICANCAGIELLPIVPGSPTRPTPGYDVKVLGTDGLPVPVGEIGALAIKLPLPPGTFVNLWNAPERYQKAYFSNYPGYYETGDAGFIDENGYVFVMSRTDDVINVAGHRLSTGAIEEVLAEHPDIAECAVTGIHDELKGQLPLGFLVLKSGVDRPEAEVIKEVVQRVRDKIGPVACFKTALVVKRLPKTRSGKVLRGTLRKIADGETYTAPATIDDPTVLTEITTQMNDLGLIHTAAN